MPRSQGSVHLVQTERERVPSKWSEIAVDGGPLKISSEGNKPRKNFKTKNLATLLLLNRRAFRVSLVSEGAREELFHPGKLSFSLSELKMLQYFALKNSNTYAKRNLEKDKKVLVDGKSTFVCFMHCIHFRGRSYLLFHRLFYDTVRRFELLHFSCKMQSTSKVQLAA